MIWLWMLRVCRCTERACRDALAAILQRLVLSLVEDMVAGYESVLGFTAGIAFPSRCQGNRSKQPSSSGARWKENKKRRRVVKQLYTATPGFSSQMSCLACSVRGWWVPASNDKKLLESFDKCARELWRCIGFSENSIGSDACRSSDKDPTPRAYRPAIRNVPPPETLAHCSGGT